MTGYSMSCSYIQSLHHICPAPISGCNDRAVDPHLLLSVLPLERKEHKASKSKAGGSGSCIDDAQLVHGTVQVPQHDDRTNSCMPQ